MTTMNERLEAAAKAIDAGFAKGADAAYDAAQIAKSRISEKDGSDKDYKLVMAIVDLFDYANGLFKSAVAVSTMEDKTERLEDHLETMLRMFKDKRDAIMGVAP